MPLVAAKCTSCGAALTVDNSKEAAICESCGTPFIVEKAITNLIMGENNSVSIGTAVINIQGGTYNPSTNNFLRQAEKLEQQGRFVEAVECYEKVLDLDYSNTIARNAIDRITNTPVLSIPVNGGFVAATLILTRKSLAYESRKKTIAIPIVSIISVKRFAARLTITTSERQFPSNLAIGSAKDAQSMELAIKKMLSERQYFQ